MNRDLNPSAAILLGGSRFPLTGDLNDGGDSFLAAMNRVRNEFLTYVNCKNHVLDLFDSSESATTQYRKIEHFLKKISLTQTESIENLFIIYIGHGGINAFDQGYYLAIRSTERPHEYQTSIQIVELAKIVRRSGHQFRKFVILDSCFSAAGVGAFQGPLQQLVREKLKEATWDVSEEILGGTTVLCAASKSRAAKYLPIGTMFFESLLYAISVGDQNLGDFISFEDLYRLTKKRIFQHYPDDPVPPEIHFPDQKGGLIHKKNIFKNNGYTVPIENTKENTSYPIQTNEITDWNRILKIIGGAISIIILVASTIYYPQFKKTIINFELMESEPVNSNKFPIASVEMVNAPNDYKIEITMHPAWATVHVNGTQYSGDFLPSGTHSVSVSAIGYETWHDKIILDSGDQILNVELKKIESSEMLPSLAIETNPANAKITLLDIVPTYSKAMKLPIGKYRAKVSAEGYETKIVLIDLNVNTSIEVDLEETRVIEPIFNAADTDKKSEKDNVKARYSNFSKLTIEEETNIRNETSRNINIGDGTAALNNISRLRAHGSNFVELSKLMSTYRRRFLTESDNKTLDLHIQMAKGYLEKGNKESALHHLTKAQELNAPSLELDALTESFTRNFNNTSL